MVTLAFVQGSNWLLAFLTIQTSQVTPLPQTSTMPFRIEDYKYFKHELFVLCILTATQINIKHMPRERLKKESLNLKRTNTESKKLYMPYTLLLHNSMKVSLQNA